ncbi:MAG: hypothetical protein AAB504_02850 [Patescibacteria group bacterium]
MAGIKNKKLKKRKVKTELIKAINEYGIKYSFIRKILNGKWVSDELIVL